MRWTIIFLLLTQVVYAQKIKLGKAPMDLLASTQHPLESEAAAAIIFSKASVIVKYNTAKSRFEVITTVEKRIKIYDAAKSDEGNIIIPYYEDSKLKERVSDIKGYTLNLDGSKIQKDKLEKSSIFTEEINKYRKRRKIAMPNVKDGSVIDFKYTMISPFIREIPTWIFQHDIPTDATYYTVRIPEYFNYNISSKGWLPVNKEDEAAQKTLTFKSTYNAGSDMAPIMKTSFDKVSFEVRTHKYSLEHVPSLKSEPYVTDMNNYRSSVTYELRSSDLPNTPLKFYAQSWDDIANTLDEHPNFGKQIGKNYKIKKIDGFNEDAPLEEKIASIFQYVQSTFTWNEYYGLTTDDGIKEMLKTKTGNTAEINLLLTYLLQKAGITAYPVAARRRSTGFMNIQFPSLTQLNYVFVGVIKEDDSIIFLDASSKYTKPGMLHTEAINMKAVVLAGESGILIDVNNPNKGNRTVLIDGQLDADGQVTIDASLKHEHSYASSLRSQYESLGGDTEKWIDSREDASSVREYDSIELTDIEDVVKPVKEHQSYIMDGQAEVIQDKVYLASMLDFGYDSNPFVADRREFAIFLNHRFNENIIINLDLPEGFSVESMPEAAQVSLPENYGKFLYQCQLINNKISIRINTKINSDILPIAMYEAVQTFFDMMVKKAKEKIVLAKV